MIDLSKRRGLAYALLASAVGVAAGLAACSGGGSSNGSTPTQGDDGGGGGGGGGNDGTAPPPNTGADGGGAVSTQPGSCATPTLEIAFSPMYSAFIPGSTAQTFALPAVLPDGTPATWSLSDPTQANLQLQSFSDGNGGTLPGVLITVNGTGDSSGQVKVIATTSSGCGISTLQVTKNTEDDWNIGNSRYNDGVSIHLGPPAGFEAGAPRPDGGFEGGAPQRPDGGGSYFETDGGTACTNCHGPTATNGPYKDVSHTPEQTAGFSDDDLKNIILNGVVPDGGYFDPVVIIPTCDGGPTCTAAAYARWQTFHQWIDITADQIPGIVCYLRALAPESQNGTSNFGGRGGRDGGGGRRDGGGGRPDAGAPADSGGD